jgi:hypothetical protein
MPAGQVNPLDTLRTRLVAAFGAGLRRSEEWADERADSGMVEKVRERHDGPGKPPDPATVAAAVAHFRRTGEPDGWRGLKRACFGAGMADEKGWCLVCDERLREKLFALAQGQQEARKRIRCYQSLLSSYWAFPLSSADSKSRAGWLALREWLDRRMQSVSKDFQRIPGWFQTLVDHRNLLRDDPCGRYGPKLLSGDGSEFHAAVSGLGVPSDSWVPEEAVLAQMRAACGLSHKRFRDVLPDLLRVATGKAGVTPTQSLRTRCVAMLVSRYARVPGTPEHPALRDAAVSVIGNPWLRRASWDASVVDERGRPDDAAREMVFGWLKRRLIKDFFELLSEDGAGDSRRLDYWLRFEPFVDDMWFALGTNARWRRDESFRDFLARAKGRLLNLEATTADNNAFVMRMGNHVAMECGDSGNALYLYRWDDLPPAASQRLLSGKERVDVTIHQLKNSDRIATDKPLRHVDSPKSLVSWEQKFDETLCPILGCKPEERPAFVPDLESLLGNFNVKGEDKRPQGGALWIYADDSHSPFNIRVKAMGFRYRSPRGWFKE